MRSFGGSSGTEVSVICQSGSRVKWVFFADCSPFCDICFYSGRYCFNCWLRPVYGPCLVQLTHCLLDFKRSHFVAVCAQLLVELYSDWNINVLLTVCVAQFMANQFGVFVVSENTNKLFTLDGIMFYRVDW